MKLRLMIKSVSLRCNFLAVPVRRQ